MSNDLEDRLRAALRPVEPPDGFVERVLARSARSASAEGPAVTREATGRSSWLHRPWLTGALAASLVLALLGGHLWQEQRERAAGLAAREQLMEALRVTSEKLDLVYEGVNSQTRRNENSGA